MKNFYYKFYFDFYCEWTQLIETFITKNVIYNWFDFTFLLLSYDFCDHVKTLDNINKNFISENLKFDFDEDYETDKISTLTINIGFLGFVFTIMIDRFKNNENNRIFI